MPPAIQARQYTVPTTTLPHRLELCQKDEAQFFNGLDIGEFPDSVPADSKSLPELEDELNFGFLRWSYRSNCSDVALVKLPDHPLSVLKVHKGVELFKAEKAAYAHLRSFNVQSCVLNCYGWKKITPKSFASVEEPTCSGPEDAFMSELRENGNASCLPKRLPSDRAPPMSYNWTNERDNRMAELDIDFSPPSTEKSWNWRGRPDLQPIRPPTRIPTACTPLQSHRLTQELAMNALDGLQQIQKALVEHGDHTEMISRNLLVTNQRVVFLDFDRAEVYAAVGPDELYFFKKDILQFHRIVFECMLRDKRLGRESRFD